MEDNTFRLPLYLPAQGASELEATIIEWYVAEGDCLRKGQALAQIDSAKSVFDFESPCDGKVIRRLHLDGETVQITEPIVEIETDDQAMKSWIPPAVVHQRLESHVQSASVPQRCADSQRGVVILGVGAYLPERVVTNAELVQNFPEISEEYVYQVTGIKERRWADEHEKPSTMALKASLEAIKNASIALKDIDAIILATTTPDAAMPSTASILQDRLSLPTIPAFDLNAACSGWLYAVSMAQGMILSGLARNVLTVGVDMQSRLLDPADRSAYFIFGDGAGAAVVSASETGHRILQVYLGADTTGLRFARREQPGYAVSNGKPEFDPWIRLEGQPLFRLATEGFSNVIRNALAKTGWTAEETRWIIPHQANGRIIKAAAKRGGLPFDRFYLNVEQLGNTSSASIPLALVEMESKLKQGDKLILCSVGAGLTTAAVSVEW
ncbi:MAG TPA: beta-ketoacyl-ACP synthase 3 [Thermoguttaceae bacterium]